MSRGETEKQPKTLSIDRLGLHDRTWVRSTKSLFGQVVAVIDPTGGRPVIVAIGLRTYVRRANKTDWIIELRNIE